jgi:hypothetical protein
VIRKIREEGKERWEEEENEEEKDMQGKKEATYNEKEKGNLDEKKE